MTRCIDCSLRINELIDAVAEFSRYWCGNGLYTWISRNHHGNEDYWWLDGHFVEQETARVMQETGIVGFILVYAARIWLLLKAISLGIRFRTPLYAAMGGVIAGFFAQYVPLIVINNPTGGIYYWFSAGLLFAMYRLELHEKSVLWSASLSRQKLTQRQADVEAAPSLGGR